MGRLISKTVKEFAESNNIDLGQITGTGQNGNVLKKDLVTYLKTQVSTTPKEDAIEAVVMKPVEELIDYDSMLEVDESKEVQKTHMRLYQVTNSKKHGERESWNLNFDFAKVGDIDGLKLARFVASKLHKFTTILVESGVRSSFSPSKPLWFEVNNGKQKLDFNLSMASNWNIFIKGKRGKNVLNEAELITNIATVFRMNNSIADINQGDIYKALPKTKRKVVKLIAAK